GGRDRETRDEACRNGPESVQTPLVAVTPGDYETAAQDFGDPSQGPSIVRARADARWTGSWLSTILTIDPGRDTATRQGLPPGFPPYIETRRLAGRELRVALARYVAIQLAVEVSARRGFRSADVRDAVRDALGVAVQPDGKRGFFHPDNFNLGDP